MMQIVTFIENVAISL